MSGMTATTTNSAEIVFNKDARSIISSLWRAVEGAVLDRTLRLLLPRKASVGLRLALTMYDGLLMAAPEAHADAAVQVVEDTMQTALKETGITTGVTIEHRAQWG